jgi:hypothetical protein
MQGVLRNWQCLNGACHQEFTAWEANPGCPGCGCVRVQWIPGGGHCAGTAKAADAELRTLAETFGLSDLHSARRGEAVKITATSAAATGPQKSFAPGFQTPIVTDANGHAVATCLPSPHATAKVKAGVGRALSQSRSVPGAAANARVEARHVGKS